MLPHYTRQICPSGLFYFENITYEVEIKRLSLLSRCTQLSINTKRKLFNDWYYLLVDEAICSNNSWDELFIEIFEEFCVEKPDGIGINSDSICNCKLYSPIFYFILFAIAQIFLLKFCHS